MTKDLHPTQGKERIIALDILRGFAIMGILVMNIQSFAMPEAAYLNPTAYGDLYGMNKWVWVLSHIFADQKFMTLFSLMYGAGIVLVTQNAEKRTGKSAGLHYRRTFWLLVIGLMHAHLIWYGDILVAYALCALLMYLFRRMRSRYLLVIGVLWMSVHSLLYLGFGSTVQYWPPESVEAARESWQPTEEALRQEIAAYLGTWSEQFEQRTESALMLETSVFLMIFLWRAGGLMLVGMALYKLGVLTASKSRRFYLRGWLVSWLIGLPVIIYGLYRHFEAGWTLEYSMFIGSQFNYWGSLFVAFGWLCIVMLVTKSNALKGLRNRLAAVGRSALTNYIFQSVICTFIFYGFGLGFFGSIDRTGQILIVLLVWAIQLFLSPWWLSRYKFGPLEWAWRSLTYMQRQTFRRETSG